MSRGSGDMTPRARWRLFRVAVVGLVVVCAYDAWALVRALVSGPPRAGTTSLTSHGHGTYDGSWGSVVWAHVPILVIALLILLAVFPWGARTTVEA